MKRARVGFLAFFAFFEGNEAAGNTAEPGCTATCDDDFEIGSEGFGCRRCNGVGLYVGYGLTMGSDLAYMGASGMALASALFRAMSIKRLVTN